MGGQELGLIFILVQWVMRVVDMTHRRAMSLEFTADNKSLTQLCCGWLRQRCYWQLVYSCHFTALTEIKKHVYKEWRLLGCYVMWLL
jgi:hypothetical protein